MLYWLMALSVSSSLTEIIKNNIVKCNEVKNIDFLQGFYDYYTCDNNLKSYLMSGRGDLLKFVEKEGNKTIEYVKGYTNAYLQFSDFEAPQMLSADQLDDIIDFISDFIKKKFKDTNAIITSVTSIVTVVLLILRSFVFSVMCNEGKMGQTKLCDSCVECCDQRDRCTRWSKSCCLCCYKL